MTVMKTLTICELEAMRIECEKEGRPGMVEWLTEKLEKAYAASDRQNGW